ncbi:MULTISPECIES: metal ABC transporter permease [unclassified Corynebacterium]|uniref:metal ABC transporter permease n=1 Tax=unclassified Corynebacterium TaxID=2624378 RepID=UPI001C44ECD5|nr:MULTISPECIES: metal ABC transporter permease [unclassified Corynebacterium]MBV7282601.1 metal ABC transporter permease [Corynebacterium sp. TAE3-ERU30]MBV7302051.1 metal ABC transporter permease [Corynebacterium sp. TAE3-ERU2]
MWTELAHQVGMAPFMFRPLILLLALGVVSGVLGVIVNLRSLEFNAEASVHAIFPGVVAGAVFGGIDMIVPTASAVAVVVAIVLTLVSRARVGESGVAIVLTGFFSLGVIISLYKGDRSGQLEALMFGRLLEITDDRLTTALLVFAVALALLIATWSTQVFTAFDRDGAQAAGVNLWIVDLTINAAIAAVVVASAAAIGVLLVIGFIIVPGAAARLVVHRVQHMIPLAIGISVVSGVIGLSLVPLGPISPQAVVALSVVAMYFVFLIIRLLQDRRSRTVTRR